MGAAVGLPGHNGGACGRDREAEGQAISAADVEVYTDDLSDLGSVRAATALILEREPRLDVLVNNAGALLPERRLSVDGFEMTFATMVLGPFVLTEGLADVLDRTGAAHGTTRVINVSSGGMYTQGLDLDDLQMERGQYRGSVAYARAKRAQVVLTERWARRWRDRGIVVHAMHPGWADTPGIAAGLPRFGTLIGPRLRSPEEGADTIVWLAASPDAVRSTGRFWLDRRPRSIVRLPGTGVTAGDAARLWDACVQLAGEGFPPAD
jgi:NAD(P)-dependent dehydrogenase (short-subunit alcohol dehydrogenase family)